MPGPAPMSSTTAAGTNGLAQGLRIGIHARPVGDHVAVTGKRIGGGGGHALAGVFRTVGQTMKIVDDCVAEAGDLRDVRSRRHPPHRHVFHQPAEQLEFLGALRRVQQIICVGVGNQRDQSFPGADRVNGGCFDDLAALPQEINPGQGQGVGLEPITRAFRSRKRLSHVGVMRGSALAEPKRDDTDSGQSRTRG
jgi:hypothetical protein